MKKVELQIEQRPVYVNFKCPYCDWDNNVFFEEFEITHGETCDWDGMTIECEECKKEIEVENVDWG